MKNMMKYMSLIILMTFFNVSIINAEELTCKYNFYDSEGEANWYANCTFDLDKKKYSCTMNYYYKGKEKTKSTKIVNYTTSNGDLSYSEDNTSAESKIFSLNKCPNYMVGFYTKNKKNGKNTNLYAAENETVKDRIARYWYDKGSSYINDDLSASSNTFLTAMKDENVTIDADSLNKIYDQIEADTKKINDMINDYKNNSCVNEDAYITKYTECKKKINSLETVSGSIEQNLDNYIKNYGISSEDSRVKSLQSAINDAKKLIEEEKKILDNADCETKKSLGLVKYCGVSPDDSNSGNDYINGCGDLPKTTALVKQIYGLIKYLIPVLIIGLSIVDFLKVLLSGEEKVYKEAWSKFVKRIMIGIVILLLPILLRIVINISGVLEDYGVDNDSIFCILS